MICSNPNPIVYADISTKPEQVLFQLPQTTQIIFDYLGRPTRPIFRKDGQQTWEASPPRRVASSPTAAL